MSAVTISVSQDDILTAVRNYLLAIMPDGVDAFQGQDNRVPEPLASDYVIMTITGTEQLATDIETWATDPVPADLNLEASTQFAVQLDVHGDDSAANAARIKVTWKSSWAAQFLQEFSIAPLYASEPVQTAFDNAENQIETRWIVTIYLQANPVVTVPQDYAAELHLSLFHEADK